MARRTRDAALVVLVLLNGILLCTVLAQVLQLPQAHAQVTETGGARFLAVSTRIDTSGLSALHVLDPVQQRLYSWVPTQAGPGVVVMLRDARDMRQDFGKQPTPAVPPRTR
jgi:hypothetical protein